MQNVTWAYLNFNRGPNGAVRPACKEHWSHCQKFFTGALHNIVRIARWHCYVLIDGICKDIWNLTKIYSCIIEHTRSFFSLSFPYLFEIFKISIILTEHFSHKMDTINCNVFPIDPFMVKLMLMHAYWKEEHIYIYTYIYCYDRNMLKLDQYLFFLCSGSLFQQDISSRSVAFI